MKKQSKTTREILERIKNKKLQIKPRWKFTLVRILRWTAIALLGIFAAINFSIAYFFLTAESVPMFKELDIGAWRYMLFIMPTIWLIIFAGLIIIAYKQFHATKQGYRYRFWIVIATLFVVTFIPGIALSHAGFAYKTYEFAKDHVPGYENMDMHDMFWNRPESGFLTGRISEFDSNESFKVHNRQNDWCIDALGATLLEADELSLGDFVRMHGKLQDNEMFKADTILLLDPPSGRY